MKPLLPAAAVAGLLLWVGAEWLTPPSEAQNINAPDARFGNTLVSEGTVVHASPVELR